MNVAELMMELEAMPEDAEVRLAVQPSWPFQHTIDGVYLVEPNEQPQPAPTDYGLDGEAEYEEALDAWERAQDAPDTPVVYIAEGGQLYSAPYLPGAAAEAMGWGSR